jgi:hypothetical protein
MPRCPMARVRVNLDANKIGEISFPCLQVDAGSSIIQLVTLLLH